MKVDWTLGATVDILSNQISREGETIEIIPRPYSTVLRQAHARTFNLIEKIRNNKEIEFNDYEIKEVVSQSEITDFAKESTP